MPVPTTFSAISATAASNSPNQAEFKSVGDEYARQILAFLKSIYDNSGNGWTSPYLGATGPVTIAAGAGIALTVTGTSGVRTVAFTSGASSDLNYGYNVGAIANQDNLWVSGTNGFNIGTTGNAGVAIITNGTQKVTVNAPGNVAINAPSSGYALNLPTKTPSSATDTGTTGDISWDSSFIYVCTATNTWKRAAIATW